MRTGFYAYCIYLIVKNVLFLDIKYTTLLNIKRKKLKIKYLNSWNKVRVNNDGVFFKEIEEKYHQIPVLFLLFSTYFLQDEDFYILSILDDNYKLFKDNLYELTHIKETFNIEIENILHECKEEKISFKNLLISRDDKYLPRIFKMGISFNVLVILNRIFNIIEKNKDININILEEMEWKKICTNIEIYEVIIKRFIGDVNWEKEFKSIFRNVMLT